ncbi:MAG: hypothetical protein HRU34_03310 [Richelia sp.]|nr:hypothetical protein [Richelia sp.]CDN17239.1 hypothetical protein RintRC_7300 [Richelia intracellularis]
MKDNLSLIAAAAGGFMLSVTLASMLHGAPLPSWQGKNHSYASQVNYASSTAANSKELGSGEK